MIEAHPKELRDMIIVEAVEDAAAFPATSHEAQLAKAAQLMGHGRFTHPQGCCKGTNAQFLFKQDGDEPNAAGIAQRAEEVGETASLGFR